MTSSPNTEIRRILDQAHQVILDLKGQNLDVLNISKPPDLDYAQNLAKVLSKLSPLVGNMIEFSIVSLLNQIVDWTPQGHWIRQDPGFPDTLFLGELHPKPGIEIKTWFPLATEITARFKDSVRHFEQDQTDVVFIAWLPEYLMYGRPQVIDIWIGTGRSLAEARDTHYNNPPVYLVIEPEDTTHRTSNLRQTNTNGYILQEQDQGRYQQAIQEVEGWGESGKVYSPLPEYQHRLRGLLSQYRYRLDTNFAKLDRIRHPELEAFKQRVLNREFHGYSIQEWGRLKGLTSATELDRLLSLTD